jgi:hypothetical protein
MIEVKGQWEQVLTMDDCLRVISYHLGLEFANKVRELSAVPDRAEISDMLSELRCALGDADSAIDNLDKIVNQ